MCLKRNRYLSILLLLLLAVPGLADEIPKVAQQKALAAAARVTAHCEHQVSRASGTVVGLDGNKVLILSVEHVLDSDDVSVELGDVTYRKTVQILAKSKDDDLSLLQIEVKSLPAGWMQIAPHYDTEPALDAPLLVCGCSGDKPPHCRTGKFSGRVGAYFLTQVETTKGASGSAVVHDGRLIGVHVGNGDKASQGYSAPVDVIRRFCRKEGHGWLVDGVSIRPKNMKYNAEETAKVRG